MVTLTVIEGAGSAWASPWDINRQGRDHAGGLFTWPTLGNKVLKRTSDFTEEPIHLLCRPHLSTFGDSILGGNNHVE